MSHTHWDGGPTCRFRTMRECNENMTQYNHGHLGRPCVKQQQPSKSKRGRMNKTETCTLIESPAGKSFAGELQSQLDAAPPEWRAELELWKRTLDTGGVN